MHVLSFRVVKVFIDSRLSNYWPPYVNYAVYMCSNVNVEHNPPDIIPRT